MIRSICLAAAAAVLAGCATAPAHYTWGSYEELIYATYAAPGKISPEEQVQILEKDYQQARATNMPVPPGWHAHLGYLYYQLGKLDQARQEFSTEKANFPESAIFVDRMLANLQKN